MVPADRPSDDFDDPNGEESDPSRSDESEEVEVDVVSHDGSTPTTEEAVAALADRAVSRMHDLVEYLEAEREAASRPPNEAASEVLDEARALREEIRAEIEAEHGDLDASVGNEDTAGDADPDAAVEDDGTTGVEETEELTAVTREEIESELQQLKDALATEAERLERADGSHEEGADDPNDADGTRDG